MKKTGFTLLELMIMVAIIGLLVLLAIPRFANLIDKSREGSTKGALSTVRNAIQVYYGDNEGWFPTGGNALDSLTLNAKYLNQVPVAKLPATGHPDSSATRYFSSELNGIPIGGVSGGSLFAIFGSIDQGGWAYLSDNSQSVYWGAFLVNCTHKDIKGETPWTGF